VFAGADQVPLVGRTVELRHLLAIAGELTLDSAIAVFVTGESGVGKTRLMNETAAQLRSGGMTLLSGSCVEIDDQPYFPLRQALYKASKSSSGAASGATRFAALIDVLAGDLSGAAGPGRILELLTREIEALSVERPLVWMIDDLQWADRSTVQLLLYLLTGLAGSRLRVFAALRAESLAVDTELRRTLGRLHRLPFVQMMDLRPLGRVDADALAVAVAGSALPAETTELVWARSGGNAFVVGELARAAGTDPIRIPASLREAVLSQVGELPSELREVLSAVAVGVEPVAHAVLAAVVPLEERELFDAVRRVVNQRLVEACEDGYRLRHRLLKEVLEGDLLPGERQALHRRHAEALDSADALAPKPVQLIYHWRLAGRPERAAAAARAAADAAEHAGRLTEAWQHWQSAVELTPTTGAESPPDRHSLLFRAAEAAQQCGEYEAARTLVAELTTTRIPLETKLHLLRARSLAATGCTAEAEVEYGRVLAAAYASGPERAAAAAHLAELLLRGGRYAGARARATTALELAQTSGDVATFVQASAALGFSQAYLEDPVAGQRTLQDAVDHSIRHGGGQDVGCSYLYLSDLLAGPLNNLEEGVSVARHGAQLCEQLGVARTYGVQLLAVASNGLFRLGRWAQADEVITTALSHAPGGADLIDLLLARCRVSAAYGDLDQARADLDAVDVLLAGGGSVHHLLQQTTLKAGVAMWQRDHRAARNWVVEGLRVAEGNSDDVWMLATLLWHGLRAEAEALADGQYSDPDVVLRLVAMSHDIAGDPAIASAPVRDAIDGFSALCAGEISRIGELPDAAAQWARAALVWERRNHPYPAAYARLHHAEALFHERSRNVEAAKSLGCGSRRGTHAAAGIVSSA
jgi:tetratricopeptide (TPR) repeat protein